MSPEHANMDDVRVYWYSDQRRVRENGGKAPAVALAPVPINNPLVLSGHGKQVTNQWQGSRSRRQRQALTALTADQPNDDKKGDGYRKEIEG